MIDKQQDFLTLTGAARRARSEGYDITYNEYNDIFRIPNKEGSLAGICQCPQHDELARCDGFRYTKNRQCMRKISHVWRFPLFYPKSTLALRCTSFSIIFKRFGGRL